MSNSHWSFSGRHWAGWTTTWAALIAIVVALPESSTEHRKAMLQAGVSTITTGASVHHVSSVVSVVTSRLDFNAMPASAFGDHDVPHDAH